MFYTHPGTLGTINFHQCWELKWRPNTGPNIYVKQVAVNGSKARHDQPKFAKVAQKPPRWVQDGVRKPLKIDKKVVFEVVCGFGRHSGVTLVLWGRPWDAAWLPNPSKIISRHYTRTCFPKRHIRSFAVASPFRMETKPTKNSVHKQARHVQRHV